MHKTRIWRRPWEKRWLLFAAGEVVALGLLFLPDARVHLPLYLALFLSGSLLSLFAARSLSTSGLGFLLLCGGFFRATLLLREPDLSHDIDRYVWDGRVAEAGFSPYAYVPAHPALAQVSPELRSRLAHPQMKTVYPPAAQAVFRWAARAGEERFWLKAFFAAADLSIVGLLAASSGLRSRFGAALYAFHPLPLTETAGQGHLDSLGVALLVSSLFYLKRRRSVLSGIAFAASVLTKYFSLASAFPLARRGRIPFAVGFLTLALAVWAAAWSPGASPAGGLSEYAKRWDFNSLFYPLAVNFMEILEVPELAKTAFTDWKTRLGHPAWAQAVYPFFYTEFFARLALVVMLTLSLLLIGRRRGDLEGLTLASLGALLLFSPTLHPWYLLWVLPFAASRREPGFLYLSYCVPLSYGLLYPSPYLSGGMIRALEYIPFALLLGWTLRRVHRASQTHLPLPLGEGRSEGTA